MFVCSCMDQYSVVEIQTYLITNTRFAIAACLSIASLTVTQSRADTVDDVTNTCTRPMEATISRRLRRS